MVLQRFAALLAAGTCLAGAAHAASPIGNAGTAVSNEGEFSWELRTGYVWDEEGSSNDDRLRVRQHIDYGFTDWYAIRIVAEQNRFDGGDYEHVGITVENRFQIFEKRKHGWDGGFRVMYVAGDGPARDEIDVRLIANVPVGENWAFRHNTILEHEMGDRARDGLKIELRTQMMRTIAPIAGSKKTSVGLEAFSDFANVRAGQSGDQDHQLGPVMKVSFENGAYLQAGYRAGLYDEAPNHLIKVFFGRKF